MSFGHFAMRRPSQLPLPLSSPDLLSRTDFIVAAGNARAVACIDAWPDWPVRAMALHGPSGSGKTHLATIWREAANAVAVCASRIAHDAVPEERALVIEDVDCAQCSPARDAALFAALERTSSGAYCLLTGRGHPAGWPVVLSDLRSRFAAIAALPLWAPDEALLAALAHKLFADRQLPVTDSLVDLMLIRLERSPAAIRDFVTRLDAAAMAEARPVSVSLVRRMLGARHSPAQ